MLAETILNVFIVIGSILGSIGGIYSFWSIFRNASQPNETFYGEQAKSRYNKLKQRNKLPNARLESTIKFEGGANRIIPQIEIKKWQYDPLTMDVKFIRTKRMVRYYYYLDDDETKERMVSTWYLK